MKISIIGAGNMAHQLGYALYKANHSITDVYNRSYAKAIKLAKHLGARAVRNINQLDVDIDLIIIAVSDDAVSLISDRLDPQRCKGISIVHTSGSVSSSVLASHINYGVIYPFQSMTAGQEIDFRQVPILVDMNSDRGLDDLLELAKSVSDIVHLASDEQRGVIHVAGVFANNFANHMIALAADILEQNALSFDIVKPLIMNTMQKVLEMHPMDAQTGPAIRGDVKIIAKHLDFLMDKPQLQNLYQSVTDSIIAHSNKGLK